MPLSELIEALKILNKYGDPAFPTHCEHDVLVICGIEPDEVSEEDKAQLETMGFHCGENDAAGGEICFYSYRYGSA